MTLKFCLYLNNSVLICLPSEFRKLDQNQQTNYCVQTSKKSLALNLNIQITRKMTLGIFLPGYFVMLEDYCQADAFLLRMWIWKFNIWWWSSLQDLQMDLRCIHIWSRKMLQSSSDVKNSWSGKFSDSFCLNSRGRGNWY